jgi:sec-independent protein translocase protein TatA
MNIAGIGPAELLVILIIALLVFGPQRLPEIAKDLGKSIGKWRQALNEIQSVADEPLKEVKELKETLDPRSIEKKLQESVQRIVTPEQQDEEISDHEVTKQVEQPEESEANDECPTSSG